MSVLYQLSRRLALKPIAKNIIASYGSLINRNCAPLASMRDVNHLQTQKRVESNGSLIALSECFRNEIAGEEESKPQPDFLKMVKEIEKSFTIVDEAGKGFITLKREHKNESIEIIFDCQDEADPDDDETAEDNDDEEEKEEEDEEAGEDSTVGAGINFKAIITKPSGEKIVVQCAAFETIKIDGVRYIAADKETKDTTLYSGPVFDYLDDDLQNAFYSYLSDRKIDDDLAHFINDYAREKEQNEYAIWLRQLAAFTSE